MAHRCRRLAPQVASHLTPHRKCLKNMSKNLRMPTWFTRARKTMRIMILTLQTIIREFSLITLMRMMKYKGKVRARAKESILDLPLTTLQTRSFISNRPSCSLSSKLPPSSRRRSSRDSRLESFSRPWMKDHSSSL